MFLRFAVFLLLILNLLNITACSNTSIKRDKTVNVYVYSSEINVLKAKVTELQREVNSRTFYNEEQEKQIQNYEQFANKVVKILNKNELSSLAYNEWEYGLFINDETAYARHVKQISPSFYLVDSNTIEISVYEKKAHYSALPKEVSELGRIKGDYFKDHVEIITDLPYSSTRESDGYVTTSFLFFKNVKSGGIIRVKFSSEIKDRLGLKNNEIKIEVK